MRSFLAILMLLGLMSAPALAAPSRTCLTQSQAAKEYPGKYLKYRQVGSSRCWFAGRTPDKSEFRIARSAPTTAKAAYASVAPRARHASTSADDLVGLAGTLCAGPCEDLRTVDPQVLAARLEAAHAAFIEYWLTFHDRWALR